MANRAWAEKVLQLLRRLNGFYSADSRRAQCLPFEVEGVQVGWVPPHVVSLLEPFAEVFSVSPGSAVTLSPKLNSYESRSDAVDAVLQTLRTRGSFSCLHGWRDEKYSVMDRFCDSPVMWMERAATSLFGVKRYGVHINAYTVNTDGELSMWLARRSATKETYPGLLDNMAAGGLAAGMGIKETAVKECGEEACVPAALANKAVPVSTISYTYEDEEGVFAESQFVFDLELPPDFRPAVGDGEVQDFYLLPITEVQQLLATDDFKPNSAMVVLDFLIRRSVMCPDTEPLYQDFVSGLHQQL